MTAGDPPLPPPPHWAANPEMLPPPARPDVLGLEGTPGVAVLVAAAVVGLAMDLAVRSGAIGAAGALLVLLAAAGLVVAARPTNPQATALAAAAPVFGLWFSLRTSPWLLPLDAVAAIGLLGAAASLARGGSLLDLGLFDTCVRGAYGVAHGAAAPGVLARVFKARRPDGAEGARSGGKAIGVGVGLLLAVPVVAVFGLLLASADPVFASFFDVSSLAGHVALIAAGAWLAAALVRLGLAKPQARTELDFRWLSPAGALTVLVALDALFAAFAAAQLVALSEGGRKVIETAGLTWAEYARSGFFQLLAVASLTIVVVMTLRGWAKRDGPAGRVVSWLGVATVALTMTLVVVAFRRLGLYIDTFGLTMLRLFSSLFTVWVGVVLALLGATLVVDARRAEGRARAWFGPAAAAAGLALLLGLNLVNPEAIVLRHNVHAAGQPDPAGSRASDTFDPEYVARLSDDAVPTLAAALPRLSPGEREIALARIGCGDPPRDHRGWAAWNAARAAADRARRKVC